MLLLRELRRAGYEVDHERVYTAEEMKEALRSSWGVIISDYRMPRFSAMEALEMANASGSDAPFIVVSGRIGEDVAVEAMRGGAYDYVMKGNLSRLPQTVERGLEKAEERRQRRKIEEELKRRDAILEAVRFAADQFLGEAAGWEESIKAVLRRLGEATEASRVYVFENFTGDDGELWATQRYEWVATGISAQIDNPVLKGVALQGRRLRPLDTDAGPGRPRTRSRAGLPRERAARAPGRGYPLHCPRAHLRRGTLVGLYRLRRVRGRARVVGGGGWRPRGRRGHPGRCHQDGAGRRSNCAEARSATGPS